MKTDALSDPADYRLAIKNRGRPPKPWRWKIYVAGKNKPVLQSDVFWKHIGGDQSRESSVV